MANNKFIRNIKIEADGQGKLPRTIQLLRAGTWNTPWHGDFEITPEDIDQFVSNYKANIGLPDDSEGKIQVNYSHRSFDKAAGWLSNLRAEEVDGIVSLLGDVEWTPAGKQSLEDGEYRYISPEFNPRALPWEDPEQEWHMVANVLTGAGLTNIPLFKKLKKVAASERPTDATQLPDESTDSGGTSKQHKEGEHMKFNLKDLRTKKATDINADERAFLESKKAELTADELKALDINANEEQETESTDAEATDTAKVEASAKQGAGQQITISASELAQLRADAAQGVVAAQKLERKEASDFAGTCIRAGQIKSDQKDSLVNLLLASSSEGRAQLKQFIQELPKNEKLSASEQGETGEDARTASEQLREKAQAIVTASSEKGKEITLGDAYSQARRENPDLAKEADKE